VRSGAARVRLDAALQFLRGGRPFEEALIVGASRGAADDCARTLALSQGVAFGVHRLSVTQVAARLAVADLAARGRTPVNALVYQALSTRATFDADGDGTLDYLAPVARTPGFSRALATTLQQLRLHAVTAAELARLPRSGADLADLLTRVEALLEEARGGDRAALFESACAALDRSTDLADLPVVLLDVPLESDVAARFLLALALRAPRALITLPEGDETAARAVAEAGIDVDGIDHTGDTDLLHVQRHLFAPEPPPPRARTGELIWLSAPGEPRECVEIARRVLREAARGVRFDEMAILLRSPQQYTGLLEHALDRAGVPAHFERGTRRPDPGGRALLALLQCAVEHLSAARFAEYLSLAQVPIDGAEPEPLPQDDWIIPPDEELGGLTTAWVEPGTPPASAPRSEERLTSPPAPWRWERLLVESSVIGGSDRWARRLQGLAEEYRARIAGLAEDDPEDPRIDRLRRELDHLAHLQAFALPVIEAMSAWPARARWGEWLALLEPFAARVLRQPTRVQLVLAALRPMAEVGPVGLAEVVDVLSDRLRSLDDEPSAPRYGKVFVAATEEARGRAFRVVFVPGLAERLFPRPLREDPLLVDDLRAGVGRLPRQEARAIRERLSLRLAAGAATDRLYVSFPRVDAADGRARVPSFYALELMRAVTGHVPDYQVLAQEAAEQSGAALAWPAPAAPVDAIDDFEHDLSVLRDLMTKEPHGRGRAQYLLQLNPHLRRSLTSQWHRARNAWTSADGIVRTTDAIRPFLETQRLGARPYSVSALQHYAACPYRFLLSAIYRLAPAEAPAPLQRLDPLTRGSLFHSVQAEVFRALEQETLLPPRSANRDRIVAILDRTIAAVAAGYAERLAPALDRVWRDEIAALARDLHIWMEEVMADDTWEPWRFEFAFGLPDLSGRDAHSLRDPVVIDGRFQMRGSIDLLERRRGTDVLRVTDYKTSRNRSERNSRLGGGTMLQPVLYSLAVEAATGLTAEVARFWYCTSAGGFESHPVPIDAPTRRAGIEVLEIVDRAVELGTFPAAPAERACARCDFRPVCGPDQERKARRKSADLLGDLSELRGRR
jgi:CRISPR/Cas system-associated exonuclease Cas4 (RecB family)